MPISYTLNIYYNGNHIPYDETESITPYEQTNQKYAGKGIVLNEDSCDNIGIDDLAMWDSPLALKEVVKLRVSNYCTRKTSEFAY